MGGTATGVFGHFDDNTSKPSVLEYPIPSSTEKGKWEYKLVGSEQQYIFHGMSDVIFLVDARGKFVCKTPSSTECQQLTN